jgi:tetratricopeptide (TPR) repeat protein
MMPMAAKIMRSVKAARYYFNKGVRKILDVESLGDCEEAFRLVEEAVQDLDKAIEIVPMQATFLAVKGVALANLGATIDASDLFERAIELEPECSEHHYQLSLCYFDNFFVQEGQEIFENALGLVDDKAGQKNRLHAELLKLLEEQDFYLDDFLKTCRSIGDDAKGKDYVKGLIDPCLSGCRRQPTTGSGSPRHAALRVASFCANRISMDRPCGVCAIVVPDRVKMQGKSSASSRSRRQRLRQTMSAHLLVGSGAPRRLPRVAHRAESGSRRR